MPTFKDNKDRPWSINFDGLLLSDLRNERKIDLADVSGDTYAKLETDPAMLTVAVCFLCGEQLKEHKLTDRSFAASLTGEALSDAMTAIWSAAKLFFPPKLLSALQSNYDQQQQAMQTWEALRPMMRILSQPDMPPPMRQVVMDMVSQMMQGKSATDLLALAKTQSATGQEAMPSTPASLSPDSAESTRAA
jgi:hypothetical protein